MLGIESHTDMRLQFRLRMRDRIWKRPSPKPRANSNPLPLCSWVDSDACRHSRFVSSDRAGCSSYSCGRSWLSPELCGCSEQRIVERGFPSWIAPLRGSPLGATVGRAVPGTIRIFWIAIDSLKVSDSPWRVSLERSKMRQELQRNIDEDETLCGTRKVLIFDEDIEDLARHAEPFEAHGFEVHKCMSVEAAMRSVEREEFEFALVDQGSPAFEGRRVIRHLVRYNSHTPFVVVARRKEMVCCQQALSPRSNGLFGKARSQRGDGSDYQMLFRKLINEMC